VVLLCEVIKEHPDDNATGSINMPEQEIWEPEGSHAAPLPAAVRMAVEQVLQGTQE
jgi:hypothetical protein